MDITETQIGAFARKLMEDLRRQYPQVLEQEARVEASAQLGLDAQDSLDALTAARLRVSEEIETSLRLWLVANDVPLAESADSDSIR